MLTTYSTLSDFEHYWDEIDDYDAKFGPREKAHGPIDCIKLG